MKRNLASPANSWTSIVKPLYSTVSATVDSTSTHSPRFIRVIMPVSPM